jgi:hypothetical protein
MLWTWIPYRRTTAAGREFVAGSRDLSSLQEAIQAGIDSIERVTSGPDESLAALLTWRRMASHAQVGEITEAALAEWILRQDVGLPPPLGDARIDNSSNAGD